MVGSCPGPRFQSEARSGSLRCARGCVADLVKNDDSIPTRQSLVARLKDLGDQESWREFFQTYWRLIHATALKAGLTDVEAQEVVQEVMIATARKMPGFTYDPAKDSLKGWLLSVTRWKVVDQFRKREKAAHSTGPGIPNNQTESPARRNGAFMASEASIDDTKQTPTAEQVPDPQSETLNAIWDVEWRENFLHTALERVKRTVNPSHYEMYHLHMVQGLSPSEAARALGVSTAAVYLAKHRVGRQLKREVEKLERGEK